MGCRLLLVSLVSPLRMSISVTCTPKNGPLLRPAILVHYGGSLHHSSQKASPLGLCMMRVPIELASPGTTADGCRCHTILSAPAMVLFLLLSLLLYFSLVVAGWNWIVTS